MTWLRIQDRDVSMSSSQQMFGGQSSRSGIIGLNDVAPIGTLGTTEKPNRRCTAKTADQLGIGLI